MADYIIRGERVSLQRKCHYTGHATILDNELSTDDIVSQVLSVVNDIGRKYESENCIPFALIIMRSDDCIKLAEDNGEIGAGDLLAACLEELIAKGSERQVSYLVAVTRYVEGAFVSDMYQGLKRRSIKEAANKALKKLTDNLASRVYSAGLDSILSTDSDIFDTVLPKENKNTRKKSTIDLNKISNFQYSSKVTQMSFDLSASIISDRESSENISSKFSNKNKLPPFK